MAALAEIDTDVSSTAKWQFLRARKGGGDMPQQTPKTQIAGWGVCKEMVSDETASTLLSGPLSDRLCENGRRQSDFNTANAPYSLFDQMSSLDINMHSLLSNAPL